MIFVTVGTHEQPFNRLIEYMDEWAAEHDEAVVIQTGYSTYEPKHCEWSKLYPYSKMAEFVKTARIVITHGGPSSIIMPLQIKKIPIVVPRRKEFNEHVNNHQVDFCKAVAEWQRNIIVIDKIDELGQILLDYECRVKDILASLSSNNAQFNSKLEKLVEEMFSTKN